MLTESVVIAFDGEAKCGKTTIVNRVHDEATYQANILSDLLNHPTWQHLLQEESRTRLEVLSDNYGFHCVSALSAGNSFRAAALYRALRELNGDPIERFVDGDYERIAEILAIDGINEVLQNDSNIERLVSPTAILGGAQEVCSALFCDQLIQSYQNDKKPNLVVVDARSPVDHLRRNNRLGSAIGQVAATNILPIYIDTPSEVAAERISADEKEYRENLASIEARRELDRKREVAPVRKPETMVFSYESWLNLLYSNCDDMVPIDQFRLDNGAGTTLENVQFVAGIVAASAHSLSLLLSNPRFANSA